MFNCSWLKFAQCSMTKNSKHFASAKHDCFMKKKNKIKISCYSKRVLEMIRKEMEEAS